MAQTIALSEVAKHTTSDDCWAIIHGNVYNLTSFLSEHPAGPNVILKWSGQDATKEFDKFHSTSFLSNFLPPGACLGPAEKNQEALSAGGGGEKEEAGGRRPSVDEMLTVFDLEAVASQVMAKEGWDYYSSGADDEITLRENHAAFQRIWFRPRILVDVKQICTKSKILGYDTDIPVYISATALARLAHPIAEVGLTKAAANKGIIQMIPTLASCSLEEMTGARAPGQIQFYQLYVNSNRKLTEEIVKRAEAQGCRALCITVDAPSLGMRIKDRRNKFSSSEPSLHKDKMDRNKGTASALSSFIDASLNWKDIAWFKSITKMPIVLKGVQCGEDAVLAAEYGIAAVILSNHGGRQLDCCRSGIEILPEVMDALRHSGHINKLEVWVDGGIRRGSDVFKALALGATAVGIGRPAIYGLAAFGQEGVEKSLEILKEELEMTMRLSGATSIKGIVPSMVDTRNLTSHVSVVPDYLVEGTYQPIGLATGTRARL